MQEKKVETLTKEAISCTGILSHDSNTVTTPHDEIHMAKSVNKQWIYHWTGSTCPSRHDVVLLNPLYSANVFILTCFYSRASSLPELQQVQHWDWTATRRPLSHGSPLCCLLSCGFLQGSQ